MNQDTAERISKSLESIASSLAEIAEHMSDPDGQTLLGALNRIGDQLDGDDGEGVPQAIAAAVKVLDR